MYIKKQACKCTIPQAKAPYGSMQSKPSSWRLLLWTDCMHNWFIRWLCMLVWSRFTVLNLLNDSLLLRHALCSFPSHCAMLLLLCYSAYYMKRDMENVCAHVPVPWGIGAKWLSYCIIRHSNVSQESKQTAELDCQLSPSAVADFQLHTTGYWWWFHQSYH